MIDMLAMVDTGESLYHVERYVRVAGWSLSGGQVGMTPRANRPCHRAVGRYCKTSDITASFTLIILYLQIVSNYSKTFNILIGLRNNIWQV